jgi:serine/threonine protein kinase
MSPQQARGQKAIDGRADIFSLGAVLYQMLTDRPAYEGRTGAEAIEKITRTRPSPPDTVNRKVPQGLSLICMKCLAPQPTMRYQSAKELAEDLSLWQQGLPTRSAPAPTRFRRLVGSLFRLFRHRKEPVQQAPLREEPVQWARLLMDLRAYQAAQSKAWGLLDDDELERLCRYMSNKLKDYDRVHLEMKKAASPEFGQLINLLDEFRATEERSPDLGEHRHGPSSGA